MIRTLDHILEERNKQEYGSAEWNLLNEEKANLLEKQKPSVAEEIIYFEEKDLGFLGNQDFIIPNNDQYNKLLNTKILTGKRSLLEYVDEQRHPIPYAYIKNEDNYFFISRESGSGETRLIGKKGMLGGHVGSEDLIEDNLEETIKNGLMRELEEEAGIVSEMVKKVTLKGVIKSDLGVDSDHLGLVYEIELFDNEIETQEEGVINGLWLQKDQIEDHIESFENWSKLVIENVILK